MPTGKSVTHVILTHYHADHIYGLQEFKRAGARIIAHRRGLDYLNSDTAQSRLAASRVELAPWIDADTRLVPADEWIAGPRELNFERYSRSITHHRSQSAGQEIFSDHILDQLGKDGEVDDLTPPPAEFWSWHPFAQMQYFDIKHRMAEAVVLGLDRVSMAHSVEARVPFLDHELVEFCARIPPRIKMKWLREKHILRRAMESVLPPDIVNRKKVPMQVPTDQWLRGELPAFAVELLSAPALRDAGFFNPDHVNGLIQRHRSGRENKGQILAAVLGTQLWDDLFRHGRFARAAT